MAQTDFYTAIKYLLVIFDDKFKETTANQDAKFDAKFQKQLQTLSLQINKDYTKFSLKLDDQDNIISSFTTSYNESLYRMRTNNKVSTNIEIGKTKL